MQNPTRDVEDIYRLSPLQEVMLVQTLFAPRSGVYVEQAMIPFAGRVNVAAFREAWEQVVGAHPVLRTSFFSEDLPQPVQVVHRKVTIPFEEHDLGTLPAEAKEQAIAKYLAEDRERGFDLSRAPLMRFAWFRLGPSLSRCVWTFHHIILDGWSVQALMKSVGLAYEARSRGAAPAIPRVRPYGDYIEWLQQQDPSRADEYWRELLRGIRAPTPFHVDRGRQAAGAGSVFAEEQTVVPALTALRLKDLARQHRVTMNTVMQGAWGLLLARYSNEQRVLFGAVVSGRPPDLAGVESMIGMFINTLPVCVAYEPGMRVVDWLQQIQKQQVESRRFEYSHLMQIQQVSSITPGMPLFDSILVFENFPISTSSWEEQKNHLKGSGLLERTNLPLSVMVIPASEILIKILYDTARFDAGTVRRMAGHLRAALEDMARSPEKPAGDVQILTAAERRQIVDEWSSNRSLTPPGTVVDLVQAQCARSPQAVAYTCGGTELTFGELNARANRLARHLQALGVRAETPVGICIERSLDFVVAMLAAFKSGGAYLPLDPTYPRERLEYMLADAGARVLVTTAASRALESGDNIAVFRLDEGGSVLQPYSDANLGTPVSSTQLACIIYTSGSTGRPKGIAIEHAAMLNRIHWVAAAYPFQPHEVACQKSAANFVDSLWELIGPLLQGVRTVIIPDAAVRDASALVDELARHRVTRILLVPSLLRALLDLYPGLQERLPQLRSWTSSGEALPATLAAEFRRRMPRSVLYNVYGSSEAWDSLCFDPAREKVSDEVAPVGRPIANMQAYILDARRQPVPVAVPGLLHIGGAALARGYLNQPQLTAEKFVPNPFSRDPAARLFVTGDLARYRPDGTIEYLGRADQQLKIRGFRVEPGEVEAAILRHPGVRRAAVIADEPSPGQKRLVAYIVPAAAPVPEAADLRRLLRTSLPEYMIPAVFVALDALPLLANGKLDRAALPQPDGDGLGSGREVVPPRTATERALTAIWRDLLGRKSESIGVHDHFFADLGGHSLLATQVVSRVRNTFRTELSLQRFFEAPTIEAVAQDIDAAAVQVQVPAAPGIQRLDRERFRVTRPE
jgi:surfactin family lipopeptide synthetase C